MKALIIIIISILTISTSSCSKNDDDPTIIPDISEKEKQDLKFLREEEKLARDVYMYAYDKYQQRIFNNISLSEQSHMDKILTLLNIYNIKDPVINERGKFSNQELQDLFNELTEQSDISLVEALKVGATVEDLDIKDIDEFESNTQKVDILDVYDQLKCGSRNHLRSFTSQLELNSMDYEPQFISIDEFNDILESANEKCGG